MITLTRKSRPSRLSALVAVLALVLGSGAVAGVLDSRFGTRGALGEAAAQLAQVPEICGQWQLLSESAIDPDIVELLACAGYVHRSYQHVGSRDTVHLAIVVGLPGRIAVHTPDICYTTQGYHLEEPPSRRGFEPPGAARSEFTYSSFLPDSGLDGVGKLIAYHAFSAGGPWQSPPHPRFAFGGRPYLMKLQLASRLGTAAEKSLPDPCRDFLEVFLPAFEQARATPYTR